MAPLTVLAFLCAIACAVILGCSDDNSTPSPTPEPSATAAVLAALAPSATAVPATAPAATQAPSASSTPTAQPSATQPPTPGSVLGPPATAMPAPTEAARPAPITLRITLDTEGQTFEPHQIHGNFDDTVVVTLTGSDDRHSFTVPIAGIDQVVERDRTSTVTFVLPLSLGGATAEGTFPFYCRFHGSPTSGMHGFLIFH